MSGKYTVDTRNVLFSWSLVTPRHDLTACTATPASVGGNERT